MAPNYGGAIRDFQVKFTIEILRANEGTPSEVMHRVTIDAMSPRTVQVKARDAALGAV